MCGICGVIHNNNDKQSGYQRLVKNMAQLLVHRGPDAEGYYNDQFFSFGHRRLSIIDLENGKQPMFSQDGQYVLVFNGEIYNYVELRKELIQAGRSFRTSSDTEVLLQSYIHWGIKALEKFNGMFAFALINRQTGNWILARDPFGIKPLYYCEIKDQLVFASEIKSILLHPEISPDLNWNGIQQYLTLQYCIGSQTLFKGIKKVEPGCFVQGNRGKVQRFGRYWDANYHIDEEHSEKWFAEELRDLLADSVRLQSRSDVPLGTYLSGGIDSSVITVLANYQAEKPLTAYHGFFAESPSYDESHHARLVANYSSAELQLVNPTAEDFVRDLPKLIYALDEPVAGPGVFPQFRVSKLASQQVKVILGGQGGDEILCGYARYLIAYLEQALKGSLFGTSDEGTHIVTLSSILPNLSTLQSYQPLMQHFWRDGLFEPMDARYFRLIDRSPNLMQMLSKDAQAAFNRQEVFGEFQKAFNHPKTLSYINKMTHFDLKTLLPALLQVEDRASMAVSVESRVPLLDTRIVDLICRMPPQIKFRGGANKRILRQACKELLPSEIYQRKDKMGFPVPFSEWCKRPPLRDLLQDVLLGQKCRERGLFDQNMVRKLMVSEEPFGREVWGLLCLELWHQIFLDQKSYLRNMAA